MDINKFIERFAEAIEVEDLATVTPDVEFRSLEEWSSISIMLTIAFFDEEYEKEINGSDLKACKTVQDLYNLATA